MFEKLDIFSMAQALAKHSAARQAVVARNVANADTPDYRARDIAAFADTYSAGAPPALRATRPGHLFADDAAHAAPAARETYRPGAASPNGNTVSLEQEVFAAAEAKGAHDRALAVYRSAMNILRTSASGRG